MEWINKNRTKHLSNRNEGEEKTNKKRHTQRTTHNANQIENKHVERKKKNVQSRISNRLKFFRKCIYFTTFWLTLLTSSHFFLLLWCIFIDLPRTFRAIVISQFKFISSDFAARFKFRMANEKATNKRIVKIEQRNLWALNCSTLSFD